MEILEKDDRKQEEDLETKFRFQYPGDFSSLVLYRLQNEHIFFSTKAYNCRAFIDSIEAKKGIGPPEDNFHKNGVLFIN